MTSSATQLIVDGTDDEPEINLANLIFLSFPRRTFPFVSPFLFVS
jgi:hypothetical protein